MFLFLPTPSDPTIIVTVSGGATPTVGQSYTLTCNISGAGIDVTYQWRKDDADITDEMQLTLSYSSLRLSNAGQYTCEVTITSSILVGGTISSTSNTLDVSLSSESTRTDKNPLTNIAHFL